MTPRAAFAAALAVLAATALAADPADAAKGPQKLPAWAFVTVRGEGGASKAVVADVEKRARQAVPAERFDKLTVTAEGTPEEAQTKALADGAKVFFSVTVLEPKAMNFPQRTTVRFGRRGQTIERDVYVLRTPVIVEMSIAGDNRWEKVITVKASSADVPGAETEQFNKPESVTDDWLKAAGPVVRYAVDKALADYFFRCAKLLAVECEPPAADAAAPKAADGPAGGQDNENAKPGSVVKIELTNQSHARVIDAQVTVEQFNKQFERWENVAEPQGLPRWMKRFRPPDRQRKPGPEIGWPVPADVDPGEKAFSEERPVTDEVFTAMKNKTCRLTLRATPAVWTLRPPSTPATLKPAPEFKP